MRYRSFGRSDVAVSALTLILKDTPGRARAADWRGIVFSGLENGINSFELQAGASPGVVNGTAEALAAIERRLSFVTLRCPVGSGDIEEGAILRLAAETAERLGLDKFDCLTLEGAALEHLTPGDLERLPDLREISRHIGVSGDERLDRLARKGAVDAVNVDYGLTSPVRERARIRGLGDGGVAVMAAEFAPAELLEPRSFEAKRTLLGKRTYPPSGGYDFLHATYGWTAEQICLAYVLTEPGVTSIRVAAVDAPRIAMLAETVDRDIPGGLAAQAEMARFGGGEPHEPTRRRQA